jgi:radical SAM protein with 4Fe4S-binding SPASM domain
LLASIKVRNLVIGVIKPSGRAAANQSLLITPPMVPYVRRKMETVAASEAIIFENFTDRGWQGFGCPATCNKLGITATGRLTTCVFFGGELLEGSIREHSLASLWREHLARADMFVANQQCARCPNLSASGGGCRARALYYNGDVNSTDPYCCALYKKKLFLERHRGCSRPR